MRIMARETVTGVKALAERLGVHRCTVHRWMKQGVLKRAILSHFRKIVIFDIEMVYKCLNHKSNY